MARADLLKRLLGAYQRRDDSAFQQASAELIEDERKKHHGQLADDLEKIIRNGNGSARGLRENPRPFDPVPMDQERKMPLLMIRRPDRYFEDLVLSPSTQHALERSMEEFRSWEILEANGLSPTRRLLFFGPPGCGKTVAAEAVSAALSLPLLYVRFDAVVSSLLGETAANLRRVFDYAARGEWVVFFDEFDAIGRSRDDVTEHGEIKRVVNSFLQILDNFEGRSLVIAATNFEEALDPAIWRRFDDVIRFDMPTREGLRALLERRFAGLSLTPHLRDELVEQLESTSFADAERLALDIRRACALTGSKIVTRETRDTALERWKTRASALKRLRASSRSPRVTLR